MNATTIMTNRARKFIGRRPRFRGSSQLGTRLILVMLSLASGLVGMHAGLGLEPRTTVAAGSPQEAPASQAKTEKKRTKAVVPFEMLPTNHMLVEARINDKGPYRLIFDLGAPITLLNNRVSEAAGVVKPSTPRSFLFGMRGEAEVNKLQVGELTADKLPVIVLDHPVLKALEDMTGRQIDGIMGFTFFARYKTTIDYHSRQMTFEPIDYQIRDLLKELPDRLMGPKVARRLVLVPSGVWGLRLGEPIGGLDSPGVPIVKIYEGSPAAHGGLKPGDVLITIDGRWTTSIADVYHAAAEVKPGREVPVMIHRDGKDVALLITPTDGA
jgi:PDZ domain/Aspartyl protease